MLPDILEVINASTDVLRARIVKNDNGADSESPKA